jgi:hypothetical protein
MWEWLFLCESLREAGMLQPGRRGLGFGAREPLVSLFAGMGCDLVVAEFGSDPPGEATSPDADGELAGRAVAIDHRFCPADLFRERVRYLELDLQDVARDGPDDLHDFDFTWSSHVIDNLGSLAATMDFVAGQMHRLKPGGLAVHTTELNLSSDTDTIAEGAEGGTVLYRRRDAEDLVRRLRADGHRVAYDLSEGSWPADRHVDIPPYSRTHLRTKLGEYETTSIALVIQKSNDRRAWSRAAPLLARQRWAARMHDNGVVTADQRL